MSSTIFSAPLEFVPVPSDAQVGRAYGAASSQPAWERPSMRLAKRAVDLTGATLGLLFLWPVMLAIAALIRLESPGPVIFRQCRVGRGGTPFPFLKFRTMVADAEDRLPGLEARNEASCGVLFKIRNDPRVTPLGKFLRRSSLDELPQLWNVLRGEMSLVGPRPLQVRDSERLELSEPDAYARRLTMPPGMSGAWQVGGRSETDAFGMLELDLAYVAEWTPWADLSIIVRTFAVVLKGRGAY